MNLGGYYTIARRVTAEKKEIDLRHGTFDVCQDQRDYAGTASTKPVCDSPESGLLIRPILSDN